MAHPNVALSIHAEFVNLLLFAACLLKAGCYTGLIAIVPFAVIDTFLLRKARSH